MARAIVQGILGVVVANVNVLMGAAVLDPTWRAICVALVMAVLLPVMAELGAHAALPEGGVDDGRKRRRARTLGGAARGRARDRRTRRLRARRGRGRRLRGGGRVSYPILMKQCGIDHMTRGRTRAIDHIVERYSGTLASARNNAVYFARNER